MRQSKGHRSVSPLALSQREETRRTLVSPLRLRAANASQSGLPSASEALAEELREADSKLRALESSLGSIRRTVANKRTHLQESKDRQNRELACQEEAAANWWQRQSAEASVGSNICHKLVAEKEQLQAQVEKAEARVPLVEAALSSDLYWRWKGVFEAYLRAGGRFEDFSLDDFLTQFYGVTKAAHLDAPLKGIERFSAEHASCIRNISEVSSVQAELRSELARLQPDISNLKDEFKELEDTNFLWWQGNLTDKPRAHELRGEKNRLGVTHCALQAEIDNLRRQKAHREDIIWQHEMEANAIRARFMPCEQLVGELEQTCEISESHGERIKQTIEMKEYELNQSQLVRTWKREIKRLNGEGPELQQEALSYLQEAAVEVQCRDAYKEEMSELRADLQECQREAIELTQANQHTSKLLASTTEDLSGLKLRHDELCAANERGSLLLERAAAIQHRSASENVSEDSCSLSPRFRPMDRTKALALSRDNDRSETELPVERDIVGAGALAFAARAAHAKTVPRPLPLAGGASSPLQTVGGSSGIASPSPSPLRFQSSRAHLSRHGSAALVSTGSKRFNAI